MFTGLLDFRHSLPTLVRNALGNLSEDEKSFIPDAERHRAVVAARWHVAIYLATIALALGLRSWLPLMLIGLPRLYGTWHMVLTGLLQHIGLADDVVDHRLNTRTVYMNPVSRFIYWNMNYHVEHHMFPMVPYHALPRLHALIKHDLPAPNPSMWHAYREVWPVLLRQLRYEDHYLRRELPATAKPYLRHFHDLGVGAAG
jgi:fatty acid desaturase